MWAVLTGRVASRQTVSVSDCRQTFLHRAAAFQRSVATPLTEFLHRTRNRTAAKTPPPSVGPSVRLSVFPSGRLAVGRSVGVLATAQGSRPRARRTKKSAVLPRPHPLRRVDSRGPRTFCRRAESDLSGGTEDWGKMRGLCAGAGHRAGLEKRG